MYTEQSTAQEHRISIGPYFADNETAESWTCKGCKVSMVGRALGHLQCTLMINSPVGISTNYINTKDNIIADHISRIKHNTNILPTIAKLQQNHPSLNTCQHFHPSPTLISYIIDSLLSQKLTDPLTIREAVQEKPGRIVGYSTPTNTI